MERFTLPLAATVSLSLLVLGTSVSQASTNCSGALGGTHNDVIVNGTSCTLNGATVLGSVLVNSGGTLIATGGTTVNGSIQVDSGSNIDLDNVRVLGDVSLLNSADVTVGTLATIGTLKLENSGAVNASGNIGSIESKDSWGVKLDGAMVSPGGVNLEFASGPLEICGSTLNDRVNVVSTTGDVLIESSLSCEASTINATVMVEGGSGNVRLVGTLTTTPGDLLVTEQNGNVFLKDVALSDVLVEKTLTGNVTLQNVITDSDISITNNAHITINGTTFGSSIEINENSGVTVTDNSASLEQVLISGNTGPILVARNCDLMLTVIENDDVTIINNNQVDAITAGATCNTGGFGLTYVEVNKNTSAVSVINNTGVLLTCTDNSPAPIGSNNTFTFTDKQCIGS